MRKSLPERVIVKHEVFPTAFIMGRYRPSLMSSYIYDGPAADEVELSIPCDQHEVIRAWIDEAFEVLPAQSIHPRVIGDQIMQSHPWLLVRFTVDAVRDQFKSDFKEYLS